MIELIPAIDIMNGKCVRLPHGDYQASKVYDVDPIEVAKEFESYGIRRLQLVDLEGAASHHIVNYRTLDQIASRTSLIIDFGGGVKSESDLDIAFENGANMAIIGSKAVTQPEEVKGWINKYGKHRFIIGADEKEGHIAIDGWQESSSKELYPFLDYYTQCGISHFLCTDVEKDSTMSGPSTTLYQEILQRYPDMFLIAAGGVGSIHHLHELQEAGVPAVVFKTALYEGKISLKELSHFIS